MNNNDLLQQIFDISNIPTTESSYTTTNNNTNNNNNNNNNEINHGEIAQSQSGDGEKEKKKRGRRRKEEGSSQTKAKEEEETEKKKKNQSPKKPQQQPVASLKQPRKLQEKFGRKRHGLNSNQEGEKKVKKGRGHQQKEGDAEEERDEMSQQCYKYEQLRNSFRILHHEFLHLRHRYITEIERRNQKKKKKRGKRAKLSNQIEIDEEKDEEEVEEEEEEEEEEEGQIWMEMSSVAPSSSQFIF